MKKTNKVATEVAINEVKSFMEKYNPKLFRREKNPIDKIKKDYPDVIEAVEDGLLIFDEKKSPKLTLREPLVSEDGNDSLATKEVTFRTRVKPSAKADLQSGLHPIEDLGKYQLRFIGYITQLSNGEIDAISPEDYDTISQLTSVF